MIETIHQSTLSMALKCGEQFRRRYIEGQKIPPGIALARGTGVHQANKVNLKQKIRSGKDLPWKDMRDAARDGYVTALEDGIFLPREDIPAKNRLLNEKLEDALRCVDVYRNEVAPSIEPLSVEEPFQLQVGLDLPLAGTMDYQELPRIGDLKTTSSKWSEGRIKEEIQPTFYSFVHERTKQIRPDFFYHILIARRGKTGPTSEEYQSLMYRAEDSDYDALFAKLHLFIEMLQKGVFPPANPTAWWCGERWCGYWTTCRYVGNSPAKRWI